MLPTAMRRGGFRAISELGGRAGWLAEARRRTAWAAVLAVLAVAVLVMPGAAHAAVLVWAGSANSSASPGVWDIGTTPNWQSASGLYTQPDTQGVLFDDTAGSAGGTTSVAVGAIVSPKSVEFNNNVYPYIFTSQNGGAISGTGAVTLVGAGSVTFSLSNNYSGGTSVTAGALTAANDAALGSGTASVGAAGTLNFTSATPTVNGLVGSGNVVLGNGNLSSATNLTVTSNSNFTFSGAISEAYFGGGSLTKGGSATLLLTSTQSVYNGGTIINAGNLAVTNSACLSPAGVTINSGALEVAAGYADTTPITFNGPNAALQIDANQTYTYNGTIAAA